VIRRINEKAKWIHKELGWKDETIQGTVQMVGCSSINYAFSVTRLYSVDNRMVSE
jgi:hypothetical protein